MPRWLAVAGLAIGVALITPLAAYTLGEYAVAPAFMFVLVLGVLLLRGSALPEFLVEEGRRARPMRARRRGFADPYGQTCFV